VEVKSGVENNEQVVVGGQERLSEGAPVHATLVERRPLGGREETAVVDSSAVGVDSGAAEQRGR
jgi:hypothetical protein